MFCIKGRIKEEPISMEKSQWSYARKKFWKIRVALISLLITMSSDATAS